MSAAPAPKHTKDIAPQGMLAGHVLVNRMLIVTYLEEFGLTHEVVASGDAAVMSLASNCYDLLLMDTAMSELDGIETMRRIRSLNAPLSHVPIVGLIANGMRSDAGAYLAAGMDAYVSKPIKGRELYSALAPFLGGAKEEPTLRLVKG